MVAFMCYKIHGYIIIGHSTGHYSSVPAVNVLVPQEQKETG